MTNEPKFRIHAGQTLLESLESLYHNEYNGNQYPSTDEQRLACLILHVKELAELVGGMAEELENL